MKPVQSGIWLLCQNSSQYRKQKRLVISFCIRDSKVIASILTILLGYLRTFKKDPLNVSVLEWKMLLKWQNLLKTVFRDLNVLVVIRRIFTFEWKVWSLRKFLNSHWWVGDLALFEVLAGETFGHLNYCLYQHNEELDTSSSKRSNAQGFSWGEGARVVL